MYLYSYDYKLLWMSCVFGVYCIYNYEYTKYIYKKKCVYLKICESCVKCVIILFFQTPCHVLILFFQRHVFLRFFFFSVFIFMGKLNEFYVNFPLKTKVIVH